MLKTEPTESNRLVLSCITVIKDGVVGRTRVPQGCLYPRGRVGGWVKSVKGIKRCRLQVIKQINHGDVKYSRENIINNSAITLYSNG